MRFRRYLILLVWFNNRDLKTKQILLTSIGSHFFLKDKKLLFDVKKPYFIFKNVSEGYYVNLGSLEPVEYASVTAKSGFEQSESLSWLRTVYDVRKIFEEKDEYVYVPDLRSFGNK